MILPAKRNDTCICTQPRLALVDGKLVVGDGEMATNTLSCGTLGIWRALLETAGSF